MLAEQIKNVLSAVAMDFIECGARERKIYLYSDDVIADDLPALSTDQAILVTFKYVSDPNKKVT